MKKPRIVFRHFSGSGPLSIYWHDGPYGDALEAIKGHGVAWLAPNGELLGVELDDVKWARDEQSLELPNAMATSSVCASHGAKSRSASSSPDGNLGPPEL